MRLKNELSRALFVPSLPHGVPETDMVPTYDGVGRTRLRNEGIFSHCGIDPHDSDALEQLNEYLFSKDKTIPPIQL